MHRVIKAATVMAAAALFALGAGSPALAKHGGGGDVGGGIGNPAPVSGSDLSGSWSGVESSFFGNRQAILTLSRKGASYEGSYAERIAGDSPAFKLSTATVTGQNVVLVFSQGGKPGLHPDESLRATLPADGRTLTGVFGASLPVTLTR